MKKVTNSSEFLRVSSLPRRVVKEADQKKAVDLANPLCLREGSQLSLRSIQAQALLEAQARDGLFAPIGVGHGKTLICLLLPVFMRSEAAVLLVPSALKKQLAREIEGFYSKHFKLADNLTVLSYNDLSSAKFATELGRLKPDLIIADEAHNLKRPQSTRTKRFLRYMRENPGCRFAALSGTMTAKSLLDYAHLIGLALGNKSPLPFGYWELRDWCCALDADPEEPIDPGVLMGLCEPGESVREGFRRRLTETHGVVATPTSSIGTSLVIKNHSLKVPAVVKECRKTLLKEWRLGDVDLTEPTERSRALRQVALGFYYKWSWPNGLDSDWMEARSAWSSSVRQFLRYRSREGIDSPALLEKALLEGRVKDNILSTNLVYWTEQRSKPDPDVEAVWLDSFVVDFAEEWGSKNEGIVWYHDQALEQAFLARGLPVYGSGQDAGEAEESSIFCSIKAQGTGKNLQKYNRNLVLSFPRGGAVAEQLLGRTHRLGQEADEVSVTWLSHTQELVAALENAREEARYIQETTSQEQKLTMAQFVGIF